MRASQARRMLRRHDALKSSWSRCAVLQVLKGKEEIGLLRRSWYLTVQECVRRGRGGRPGTLQVKSGVLYYKSSESKLRLDRSTIVLRRSWVLFCAVQKPRALRTRRSYRHLDALKSKPTSARCYKSFGLKRSGERSTRSSSVLSTALCVQKSRASRTRRSYRHHGALKSKSERRRGAAIPPGARGDWTDPQSCFVDPGHGFARSENACVADEAVVLSPWRPQVQVGIAVLLSSRRDDEVRLLGTSPRCRIRCHQVNVVPLVTASFRRKQLKGKRRSSATYVSTAATRPHENIS